MSDRIQYKGLSFWLICHLRSLLFAVGELTRAPFQSIATLLVIGIAMALPIGFYALLNASQNISQHWHNQPSITLYLKKSTDQQQAHRLLKQLEANPAIQQAHYISPRDGLNQFAKMAHIENILSSLKNNPLPAVIVITPAITHQQPEQVQQLLNTLPSNPNIDSAQIDQLWVKRFYYILTVAQRICYALAFVFAMGVILITGNTIRLCLQSHQQEISLLRLIGATPGYIIRPMLYRGLLYGLLGGVIALILVMVLFYWLSVPLAQFAATYSDTIQLHLLKAGSAWAIVVICGLLGLIGAWVASRQFLHQSTQ